MTDKKLKKNLKETVALNIFEGNLTPSAMAKLSHKAQREKYGKDVFAERLVLARAKRWAKKDK
ncbi:hypothetical protein K9M47_03205 [Candidatus Gracilibacteria bacterium]|nr:hypothetical protein [Candidatus Gracilibacteria bacterium]